METFIVGTETPYQAFILILLVIFVILYYSLYKAYKQLKKDIQFLNESLKDRFLSSNEFIVKVDINKKQISFKNPHGNFSQRGYAILMEYLRSKIDNFG